MRRSRTTRATRLGAALALVAFATAASAAPIAPAPLGSLDQQASAKPGPLDGVGIEQHLGESLPLDAVFRDDEGKEVRLGDYFGPGKRPVVLALAYFECPMLCTLVLNGTVKALRPMSFTAGTEYDVIAISIDPEETHELAREKKAAYLESYARRGDGSGFHFLTGPEKSIRAVADAVGFQYRYVPESGEFAHAASIYVVTPLGKLSRYFFGVEYSSRDLRLALVEATAGKIGGAVDQLMLFCYRYDPTTGKYSAQALTLVRLGGILTALSLAGFVGLSQWREARRPSSRS
ncbi:MAG: SCO family protein [Candidatus Binatia bacterium]